LYFTKAIGEPAQKFPYSHPYWEGRGLTGESAPASSYWAHNTIHVISQVLLQRCLFFKEGKALPFSPQLMARD